MLFQCDYFCSVATCSIIFFAVSWYICCRKTAVCNGDQFLDFSVLELVRSQSTFSTGPEVLSGSSSRQLCCSVGFHTMHVVCTDLLCVVCIGLLYAESSTVNTGLGRPMSWKPLCLLSTPEVLVTTNYQLT